MVKSVLNVNILRLSIGVALLSLISLSLSPRPVQAHVGGKSAIKVNDQSVLSNAFSAYYNIVPSDDAPVTFVPNQPIEFEVDQTVIPGGSNDFRWYWEGDQVYESGASAKHAFSKVGMYIVNLKFRGAESSTYDTIDTIGITIVPFSGYRMPSVKVSVSQAGMAGKPYTLSFQANASVDPSTKLAGYKWQFADGIFYEGKQVTHGFKDLREINNSVVAITITDANGLKTNATIHPLMNSAGVIDSSLIQNIYRSATPPSSKPTLWLWLGVGTATVVFVALAARQIIKHRRAKKSSDASI